MLVEADCMARLILYACGNGTEHTWTERLLRVVPFLCVIAWQFFVARWTHPQWFYITVHVHTEQASNGLERSITGVTTRPSCLQLIVCMFRACSLPQLSRLLHLCLVNITRWPFPDQLFEYKYSCLSLTLLYRINVTHYCNKFGNYITVAIMWLPA